MRVAALLLVFLIRAAAQQVSDSPAPRILHPAGNPSAKALRQEATLVQAVGRNLKVSTDELAGTLAVDGAAPERTIAEWLVDQMNEAPKPGAAQDHAVPGATDDSVHIQWLAHAGSPQSVQEMLTVIRTVAELQHVYAYSPRPGEAILAMRGPAAGLAVTQWLVGELDVGSPDAAPAPHDFTVPDSWRSPRNAEEILRVRYLAHHRTPQEMNQILTAIRTTGEVQKTFVYTALDAIVYRDTPQVIDTATRIIDAMDQASGR